jgi:hemerythrin
MALIQWDEKYSVQVEEMNRQHKKLIDLINELYDAMGKGKGKEVLGKIITELLNYTVYHFTAEEKLFNQFNYPEIVAQKAMHKLFIDKVNDFKNQFESGRLSLSIEITDFLSEWLKKHIMIEDKKYGSFINAKGMK